MFTSRIFRAALPVAIALAFVSTAALAADPAPRLLATAGGVQVDPMIAAPAYQLRIVGPDGKVVEDTHLDGESMLILPKNLGYARWIDGTYHYELVPVLGVRQRGDSEAAQLPGKATANLSRGGTFSVQGGVLRLPGKATTSAAGSDPVAGTGMVQPADVVTPDDAIIQSSLCVGFDCVDGESFGFDTIRLKENNTRLKFDDTSASAGFPANDWTIVANDSASGGASYLGFEDVTGAKFPFKVSAGAPTNTLFVSSQGNIGIGTSTPVLDVHLVTSDTPVHRLEQTSAGGFTAQTWDIAGNEANFFVRDVTSGSRLPFRIRPGAPTSSLDISAVGNVGIGTASPAVPLHVHRTAGNATMRLSTQGAIPASWDISLNTTSGRLNFTDDATGVRVPFKIGKTANDNLFRIGTLDNSTVEVNGKLKVTGDIQVSGSVGPDYVFAPGFALPTIDDHAAFMTENRHLPKVGPAKVDEEGNGVMNLGALSHGMLEELEYAHLYIADLDRTVDTLQQRLDERDAQVQALLDEVKAIRAELDAE